MNRRLLGIIPSQREWKRWTPATKIAYVAQVAAPLTLLATVVFSFLSWREAVEARLVQQQFFISQNPPEFDLIDARIYPFQGQPWMWFTFKNVGASEARAPCLQIHGDLKWLKPEAEMTTCGTGNDTEKITVQRNRTFPFQLPLSMLKTEGPAVLQVWRPGDPPPKCDGQDDLLLLDVRFKDVLGAERHTSHQVMICHSAAKGEGPPRRITTGLQ